MPGIAGNRARLDADEISSVELEQRPGPCRPARPRPGVTRGGRATGALRRAPRPDLSHRGRPRCPLPAMRDLRRQIDPGRSERSPRRPATRARRSPRATGAPRRRAASLPGSRSVQPPGPVRGQDRVTCSRRSAGSAEVACHQRQALLASPAGPPAPSLDTADISPRPARHPAVPSRPLDRRILAAARSLNVTSSPSPAVDRAPPRGRRTSASRRGGSSEVALSMPGLPGRLSGLIARRGPRRGSPTRLAMRARPGATARPAPHRIPWVRLAAPRPRPWTSGWRWFCEEAPSFVAAPLVHALGAVAAPGVRRIWWIAWLRFLLASVTSGRADRNVPPAWTTRVRGILIRRRREGGALDVSSTSSWPARSPCRSPAPRRRWRRRCWPSESAGSGGPGSPDDDDVVI